MKKILIILFIFNLSNANAQELRIIDGDTILLNGKKIRFSGIDTPELKQKCIKNGVKNSCGITAKKLLTKIIGNNNVDCISEGQDQYHRILAECFVNNESLSSYLVKNGYAFAYRKYSKKFIDDEDYARTNELGMWSMQFEYPWDFRKNN